MNAAAEAPQLQPAVPRARRRGTVLAWLLAGAVMLPLLVAIAGAWLAWRATWDSARGELTHTVDAAAEYMRRVLDGHRSAADRVNDLLLGLSDAEIRTREAELHERLRALVPELPQVLTAYVGDRDGMLLLSASMAPVPRISIADREFHRLLAGPNPPATVVSRVYKGRAEDNLFFAVARPRRSTGNAGVDGFQGQVNVSVDPRLVSEGLARLRIDDGDSLAAVRADGFVLARSPAFQAPLPQLAPDGALAVALRTGHRGIVMARSRIDDVPRLVAFRGVEGWPGVSVGAGRDQATVIAAWRDEALFHLAIALPAMLALMALGVLVWRGQRRLAEANTSLERRVAERTEALRSSEARLRLATEGAGVGTWELDLRTGEGQRSPEAQAMLGSDRTHYTLEESVALIHPDDREAAMARRASGLKDGEPYDIVFRTARPGPDNQPRWVLLRGRVERDADGRPVRLAGVVVDVTAQRRAEQARHDSEARFRAFQDLSPVGFVIHRAVRGARGEVVDFEVEYANPAAHRAVNAPVGVFVGGRLLERLPQARTDERLFPRYLRILSGEEPGGEMDLELRHGRFNGWFRNAVVRLDAERLAVSVQNTTAEHEARETMARSHAELEALVEARTAALLRAADEKRRAEEAARQNEKLAALGQLVGGVAHDFNNLLQVIGSGASLLRRPALTEARRMAVLDGMERAGETARELTGRLLAFARQQPLVPETFNLNARVLGMTALLRQTLGAGVQVETELAPDLWLVNADTNQLELAVLNLAVNARDAMPEGGRLLLRTRNATLPGAPGREAGDYVCLDVVDSGIGMAPAVLARALDPFFSTKETGRGTGLGLPQVFGFTRQSGGDLRVESTPGQGTTVIIKLPRASADDGDRDAAALAALRTPKGKSVLVVEDNVAAGEFAASLLEELGYQASTATTAVRALERLQAGEAIDAVFSDVVMPGGMSGNELAVALRQAYPGIAVVLATGYGGQAAGVAPPPGVETLAKPYQLVELAAALERALAQVAPKRLAPA